MPKKGAIARCFCADCARAGGGFSWRSVATVANHRALALQQEWLEQRNQQASSSVLDANISRIRTDQHTEPGLLGMVASDAPAEETASCDIIDSPPEHLGTLYQPDPFNLEDQDMLGSLDMDAGGRTPEVPREPPAISPSSSRQSSPLGREESTLNSAAPHSIEELQFEYGDDESESMYLEQHNDTSDPPFLRLAYLNAMVSSIIFHNSTESVDASLHGNMACLRLAHALPEHSKPLVTLESVRRHLGLETDPFMLRQGLCSICFTGYSPDDISDAPDSRCTFVSGRTRCAGHFWVTRVKNNTEVRRSPRYICYTRIIPALRRMFLRPSFVEMLRAGKEAHSTHNDGAFHDVCCGSAWKSGRIGMRRVFRADGSVFDEPETPDSEKAMIELGFGLYFAINIDWFRTTAKSIESTGAVYLTIQNLERTVRFLPANVILACVVPGPKEPSLEQLNWYCSQLLINSKSCVVMKIYNEALPARVHGAPLMTDADTPARCKCQGTAGHAHDRRFCRCESEQKDINTPKGYDILNFVMVDENILLQKARESYLAPTKVAASAIHKEFGIRWSALNELPDWKPYASAPVDPMHNLFLGIVNDCWYDVLIAGYYFTAAQKRDFDNFMSDFEWPSRIGRLPNNLCEKGGVRKADEWRRLISILPIALWSVWRDPTTDLVPTDAPPIHDKVAKRPVFQRSCHTLHNLVVLLSSACRILTSWTITPVDIERAQKYLQLYCQGLLQMGVSLKPNHHFSMHYQQFFHDFGPAYAWWLFSYERFNGLLEKVKINGKSGDTSTTLMRFWIRLHRLYEMVENRRGDVTDEERQAIARLCFGRRSRGTLLSQAAGFSSATSTLRLPCHFRKVNLRELGSDVYLATLRFARKTWPDLNLTHDRHFDAGGMLFLSSRVAEELDFIYKAGIRYGSTSSRRTLADRYILARFDKSELFACRIEHHFRLTVAGKEPALAVAIRRFVTSNDLPITPWDLHADDLGYFVAHADRLGTLELITPDQIFSLVGLSTITTSHSGKIWIAVSYNRTGEEFVVDDMLFDEMDGGEMDGDEVDGDE